MESIIMWVYIVAKYSQREGLLSSGIRMTSSSSAALHGCHCKDQFRCISWGPKTKLQSNKRSSLCTVGPTSWQLWENMEFSLVYNCLYLNIRWVPTCAPDKGNPKFELHNHNPVGTYLSIRSSKNITKSRFLDGVCISIHCFGKILNDRPEQVAAISSEVCIWCGRAWYSCASSSTSIIPLDLVSLSMWCMSWTCIGLA